MPTGPRERGLNWTAGSSSYVNVKKSSRQYRPDVIGELRDDPYLPGSLWISKGETGGMQRLSSYALICWIGVGVSPVSNHSVTYRGKVHSNLMSSPRLEQHSNQSPSREPLQYRIVGCG